MSLTSIMNIANSGMHAAQTQLRVVSDNVANVNTPGYVRKIADQQSTATQGVGSGVEVARIRLATDRFLQAASLNAGAEAGRQGVRYELFDRIQTLFGDPSGDNSFFTGVDDLFAAFSSVSESPTSSPLRQDILYQAQALFDQGAAIGKNIQATREEADGRLRTAVDTANDLLSQIEDLNKTIAAAAASGDDATGSQTTQATLLGQLSQLMDIKVTGRANGGVMVRTGTGALLAGQGHATLAYSPAGSIDANSAFNEVWVTEPGGQKRALLDSVASGEIKGLVELRDVDAPAAAERLGELMAKVADELNRAHNANASVPAPTSLTGRNTGQSWATAIAGFTGTTNIVTTNASGVVQQRAEIVFGAGGAITINGGASSAANFEADLEAALGGQVDFRFQNGTMSLTSTGVNGIAIADDPTAPASKVGRGFSHFFGLNDLVSTTQPAFYETGLSGTSSLGLAAGGALTLRFTGESGARLKDVTIAAPAGAATVDDLLAALNNPATGAGRYGQFSLDAATGALTFQGAGSPAPTLSVLNDTTSQSPSGVSVSALFGIGGGVRAARTGGLSLRADIQADSTKLALARLNLGAAAGTPALTSNDGSGALALADAGKATVRFDGAGGSVATSTSITRYAADFSGDIGSKAAAAETRRNSAEALLTEAQARQTSHEGVNLDEELVMMTTYQQAFNASARLIQAAKDMYDTLLGMI